MAPAAEEKHPALDCKLDFDTIKGAAYALPGAETSEKPDWDMVHVKSRAGGDEQWWIALFVFTQKGHYAYPTVTLKSIWKAARRTGAFGAHGVRLRGQGTVRQGDGRVRRPRPADERGDRQRAPRETETMIEG